MGKHGEQPNLQQPQRSGHGSPGSSRTVCVGCPMGPRVNLRCIAVLILGLAALLTGLFWVLPFRSRTPGYDAKDSVKLSATVQASFKLEKPVSELIPRIARLEYDIFGEIGAPDTKVAVLSMHQARSPNYTNVVFGVLSDPINVPFNPVSLIMLKSSFVDLFMQLSNLTLTTSVFGPTSEFQILKCPGGVSVIPRQSATIWPAGLSLFNFTINNSISGIQGSYVEFQEQLKGGLHLKYNEHLYVEVSSREGSTISSPVMVQASVVSDLGIILLERLKELARIITGGSVNLGLDNSVFGKVKGVILSSYLKGIEDNNPPSPSPAPSPGPSYQVDPLLSPAPSPNNMPSPCPEIKHSPPIPNSPSPAHSPRTHRASAPPLSSSSSGHKKRNAQDLVSPSLAPSPSSSVLLRLSREDICLLGVSAVLIHLFNCL